MQGDRRRSVRLDVLFPVTIRETSNTHKTHASGLMKNFSLRGALVVTDAFLSTDSRVVLEMVLPTNRRALAVTTRVARVGKYDGGYRYEIGGEFENLSLEDSFIFSDFIAAHA